MARWLLPFVVGVMVAGCNKESQQSVATTPRAVATATGSASPEAKCTGQDPRVLVRAFYEDDVGDDGGLPSQEAMSKLKPIFSQRLTAAIEHARFVQHEFIRIHPGDKPPYIEGSLFGSLFEGFTAVEGVTTKVGSAPATISVALVYDDGNNAPVRWSDDVLLLCEQGKWRIDDVEYGGDWDFSTKGRLREGLEAQ